MASDSETARPAAEPVEKPREQSEAPCPRQPGSLLSGPTRAAVAVSVLFFVVVFCTQSLRSPHPRHGDIWTEMQIVTSARNFVTHGFGECFFTPTIDRGQDIGLPAVFQSEGRHPSGTTVVVGLVHSAGFSLAEARAVPLALSALSLLVFFALIRRVLGEDLTPLLAVVAVAVVPAFWLLADSLYYFGYDFLLKPLFWLFICLATFSETRRGRYLAGAVLVGFVQAAFSSYEMLPAMGVFCLFFPLLFGKGVFRERASCSIRFCLFVGLGFGLALASRFAHLAVLHGGLEEALHNFRTAFRIRSQGVAGIESPLGSWTLYLADTGARIWYYYPVHVVFVGVALGLVGLLRAPRPAVKLVALLGGAEGVYFLLMPQHCNQHLHTLYHLVFTAGLLTALAVRALGDLAEPGQPRAVVTGGLAAIFALAALTVGPVRTQFNLDLDRDWSAWVEQSQAAAAHIPADGVVVMNTWTDPKYSFFLNRTFIQREGYDYKHMRKLPPWGVRELRALDTKGRSLFVVSRAQDPNYPSFCRELRHVTAYGAEGERLEVFEVVPRRTAALAPG